MLFSRNPIGKPSRLTPVGTKNSLLRLQNHLFSLFSYMYDVFASKWYHKFMIWCPTIPYWTPKLSQTSSASSAGRPSGLAQPGRPGLASQAARSCRRGPGWPPPGGPGHHSTDPRTAENALTAPCFAARRRALRPSALSRAETGNGILVHWSGGATPAHGMSAKRVERVALGRLVLRPSVRTHVRHTQKGAKMASESSKFH